MQEVIIKYNGDISPLFSVINARFEELFYGYGIITLDEGDIPFLYEYPEIEYIEFPKRLELLDDAAKRSVCLYDSPGCEGVFIGGECLDGSGIAIGVIDSGVDYREASLISPDGATRLLSIYDLSLPSEGRKGTEFTREDINLSLSRDTVLGSFDYSGHGTAVASLMASIAPNSPIIAVKLGEPSISFVRSTDIMRGVKYVIDKARSLFLPVCINISYGTNFGAHNGNSLFEGFLDTAASVWKNAICIPTGNEGNTGKHYGGTLSESRSQNAEFVIPENSSDLFIIIYKDLSDVAEIEITAPNGEKTPRVSQSITGVSAYSPDNSLVYIEFIQPTHYDPESYFLIRFDGTPAVGIWSITLYGLSVVSGRFDMWLPVSERSGNARFLNSGADFSITIPSTAKNVISVGGIDRLTRNPAVFSGRGFTERSYIKPDVAAPAVNIAINGSLYTGTSFASPFAAASCALLMQWGITLENDPFLYGQRLKAFLRIGAERAANTVYPNGSTGFGILCTENSLAELKKYSRVIPIPTLF